MSQPLHTKRVFLAAAVITMPNFKVPFKVYSDISFCTSSILDERPASGITKIVGQKFLISLWWKGSYVEQYNPLSLLPTTLPIALEVLVPS